MALLKSIIVNGTQRIVQLDKISFNEVVALAFGAPDMANEVTFMRGFGAKTKGTLIPGESVNVCDSMIFTATWIP